MSRLSKRQLREQQELAELSVALESPGAGSAATDQKQQVDSADESAPAFNRAAGGASLFAALGADDDAGDDDDEDAVSDPEAGEASVRAKKKRKPKKKKKAAKAGGDGNDAQGSGAATGHGTPSEGATDSPRPQASSKASGKKKKGGAGSGSAGGPSTGKGVDDMSLEELDALLASQTQIGVTSSSSTAPVTGTTSPIALQARSALSITASSLDPSVELKKQFGSAAIRAFEAETRASGNAGAGGTARARIQARNPNLKIRSFLVQPKGEWPPVTLTKSGMHMEEVTVPGRGKCYTFVHSRSYLETQIQFLEAVHSHDSNRLYNVFYAHPWHIDTLLQLSDISRHQGDLGQAGDWNARALWAFERAALPPFAASLTSTSGPPQLDFSRKENRAFFLAAHRQVGFLGRRGTWRTALEWVKLIIGLDLLDPHAMLLWMDFLALKAGEEEWYLDALEKLDAARSKVEYDVGQRCTPGSSALDPSDRSKSRTKGALDWCVGLWYGKALALRSLETKSKAKDHTKSTTALKKAIARHPEVLQPLADKIGATLPTHIVQHPYFIAWKRHSNDYDSLPHLLANIYTIRSESLWKDSTMASWLTETAQSVYQTLKDGDGFKKRVAPSADNETRDSVYRHILASDLPDDQRRALLGFVPPSVTKDSSDACDPLPPIGADGQRGNHDYFSPLYRNTQRRGGGGQARTGLDPEAGVQGERFYEAMMNAQAEHPEELRNLWQQMEALAPELRNVNANGGNLGLLNRFRALADQVFALGGGDRNGGEDDDGNAAGEAVGDEGEWDSGDDESGEEGEPQQGRLPGGWA
ncbi:hypothetical protein OC846_002852 [Tilletia horrida]|uniref:DUF654-domain-containing protein n=1 Tax=Tilletia horrida TaxID=155126 RepID=A0AAN6GRG0_9BASI|nr:hypothetical protein OC846_002852 [Tilletia horrida]KAK0568644.1 hypothetical protein OC861_001721 [Tilletia horrida]